MGQPGNTPEGIDMIYVATNVHGRGDQIVTSFYDKNELVQYAFDVLAFSDIRVNRAMSVQRLLEALHDKGPGFGSRSHRCVKQDTAIKLIRDGAKNDTLMSLEG
jgi:hypothetical protein